ncbi:hypothetical protein McaMca56_001989 [Microsporum canis]
MRVVIAGNGDLARYICEEFTSVGHELVILTRSHNPQLERPGAHSVYHRLYSGIPGGPPTGYRGLSGPAAFYSRPREPIRKLLREQTDLEWTLVSVSWLADYVVSAKNRYIKEIGVACPINLADGSMVIPGTGNEPVDFAWARDIAKALEKLVIAPAWEPYTFTSGEQSSWNEVARIIRDKYRPDLKVRYLSLGNIVETVRTTKDDDAVVLAEHQLLSASHACSLPQDKVQAQRPKYFPGIYFRTLRDGLAELDRDAGIIA